MPGLFLFLGRLILLAGLYAVAFAAARTIWRGQPAAVPSPMLPRTVTLALCRTAGPVTIEAAAWLPGDERQLALPVTLGRADGNTIRVDDVFVSSCHAELAFDGTSLWLVDRGSKNGTWAGSRRLNRPYRLKPGDAFAVGGTVIRLVG